MKGLSNLPIPKENYYAPFSKKVVTPIIMGENMTNPRNATAASTAIATLLIFDQPGLDELSESPPIFVACLAGKCRGGTEFECMKGYTGTLCSECEREKFYWNGKCDTSCEDNNPRGLTTTLGIIGVIIVWLILNKSAGGMYDSADMKRNHTAPQIFLCARRRVSSRVHA